jgi:hypothetical protein
MWSSKPETTELWFELTRYKSSYKVLVPLSKVVEFEECYDEATMSSYTIVHYDAKTTLVSATYEEIVDMIKKALKDHNPC